MLGAASGAVAGLVAITPGAGFVGTVPALIIGGLAGVLCYLALFIKERLNLDDALDVLAVHLVGGIFGSIAVGFFAASSINSVVPNGLFSKGGNADLLVDQVVASAAVFAFALVGSITEAVRALFWPVGEAAPRAGLWYPAYWEDIEETPAHILLHTFSGQGYHYRQCFLENKLLPAEYDAIFPQGHDADDASVMAMLCFDRLRWPWQLSDAARDAYRDFLKTNTGRVLTRLLKAQDTEGIKVLLALDVMDTDAFAEGAALAAKADNAEAAALLADAEHKKRAAAPQKKRYDFDF